MTGRRNGNRIRGPQSALTDFLAVSILQCTPVVEQLWLTCSGQQHLCRSDQR